MRWPSPHEISIKVAIPDGLVLDMISQHEVGMLSMLLGEWYPDITVGTESSHLDPNFFYNHVTLKESIEEKSIIAFVLRHQGHVIAFYSAERNILAKMVFGRLAVVSPFYRQSKLGNVGLKILSALGECTGSALVWGTGTMKHSFSQRAYEDAGFRLVGIMPAYDRDEVEPHKVRHVFETVYAKVLVPPDQIEIPRKENMTTSVQLLWDHLFKNI